MEVVTPQLISGKRVLLRMDIDVPLRQAQGRQGRWKMEVEDDFRLKAGLPTLKLCLEHAQSVVVMGHLGRPEGKEVPELSVAPIVEWLENQEVEKEIPQGKIHFLENLRFEPGESFEQAQNEDEVLNYAKELAKLGDVFINESFAAYRPSASTTVLPTLLPHGAGLRFAHEVKVLTGVRENPKRPLIAIVGGAKVEDKLPLVEALSGFCDAVLVGGLLPKGIKDKNIQVSKNVMLGKLNEAGIDLSEESIDAFARLVKGAKQIIKNGTIGKWEDPYGILGTEKLARAVLESEAETIVGGGDIIAALGKLGLLERFEQKGLVSVGGGATLNFLINGTLPTIEALK